MQPHLPTIRFYLNEIIAVLYFIILIIHNFSWHNL